MSKATTAVLLLLDVGPRNFQFLQSINMQCVKVLPDRKFGEYLPSESSAGKNSPVFQTSCRSRKNYQGLIMCLVYKDGWSGSKECPNWVLKCFLEPVLTSSQKEKEDICGVMVVNSVPELEKYRPHLFSSIRDICAALSSRSLPKLKKKFLKDEAGLPIGQFTEVLFRQLYETHPRIADDSEAPYAVAMLQEMFHQIDYNGDQTTNWDEFTTFCVQTGVVEHISSGGSTYSLDDYIIEYGEEPLQRDHILSGYRLVCQMRHIPENRKLVVIPEESDNVMILDERFRMHSQIYPAKVHVVGTIRTAKTDSEDQRKKHGFVPRAIIYDCIYLTGRDLYCYCSSDHSITICKELSSLGGKRVNYIQHNRFYHSLLHMKLCWSEKHNILCSTASDRTIYGWNIDDSSIIFQINRHSDNITDFICVDALDIFITCGMDKRIVMWSAVSRRVKGILLGHKRGVRCLSQYENTLLSAGFELEAKTWDMAGKDCVAVLRGHRSPIVCARLMCAHAHSEKDYRAITVDEGGEFRLWNIYVRERTSDPVPVPTLQIFNMQNPESPLDGFRFLALPYSPLFSTSYYSDIIACSTKLLHFLPEKNVKEFIPPTACKINEASSSVVTSVGKNILLYDIGLGRFSNVFEEVSSADITALCMDGERGRKMFLGNSAGNIMLVNSTTGVIIDRLVDSHSRDVTAILQSAKSNECIYSSSLDGHIRRYEQSNGQLNVHNFIDYAFGEGIGVTSIKLAETIHILVATSAGKMWGLWHNTSFKKLLVIHEEEIVTAVEIIGVSRDAEDITMKMSSTSEKSIIKPSSATKSSTIQNSSHGASTVEKENMMTLAVAVPSGVIVYTFDVVDMRGIRSFKLCTDRSLYITDLTIIKSPDISSVNYSSNLRDYGSSSHGYQLVASTDDGNLVLWDTSGLRTQSDWKFRKRFQGVPPGKKHLKFLSSRRPSSASSRDDVSAGNVYISGSSKKGDALSFKDTSKLLKQSTAAGSILSVGNDVEKHAGLHSHDQRSAGNRKEQVEVASSWIELTSTEMFVLAQGEKDAEVVMSRRIWNAHSDIIPFAVPLHSHGCLVTVSHDGYHRMWNLDAECLGELALPNITESMKKNSRCNEPGTAWKFILEKIPVTQGHIDVANALRMNMRINPSRGRRMDVQTMERRNNGLAAGFRGFRDASIFSNEEENEIPSPRSQVRRQVLHSLSEPPAAPDDVPPSRVPTKEEKELLRLSLNLEEPAFRSGKSNIMKNSNEMPLSAPGNIESFQRGDSKNFATKSFVENSLSKKDQSMLGKSWMAGSTDSLMMSYFGVPSLW